jgi:hypothetical protein
MVDNRKEKITVYLSIIIYDFLFKFLVSGTYSYIIFALIKDGTFLMQFFTILRNL